MKKLFLLLAFLICGITYGQVYTHTGTVRLTKPPTSKGNTSLLSIDSRGLVGKTNIILDSISSGYAFKTETTGLPASNTEDNIYRNGNIGIGEPNPQELLDIVGTETSSAGVKFNYTYTNGQSLRFSFTDTNLSEQSLPDARIFQLSSHYNGIQFPSDNYYSYVWGGDTSMLGAYPITLASGVADAAGSNYARQWAYASIGATRADDEFTHLIQARNEDNDLSFIKISTVGDDPGFDQEAVIEIHAYDVDVNGQGLVLVHNHGIELAGLVSFTDYTTTPGGDRYGQGVFIEGYTHGDDIGRTGTAATVIGAPTYLLGSDGEVMMDVPLNRLRGYTVAGLPSGTTGDMAYVTDSGAVTYRGIATGGGSTVAMVFYDGTNWIYH